jgi:hypothetical protein
MFRFDMSGPTFKASSSPRPSSQLSVKLENSNKQMALLTTRVNKLWSPYIAQSNIGIYVNDGHDPQCCIYRNLQTAVAS